MVYCSKCGKVLSEYAGFCTGCGAPIRRQSREKKRVEIHDGVVYKCPNCGQTLDALEAICPTCGYELRGAQAVGSLRDLSVLLQQIGAQSNKGMKQTLFERLSRIPTEMDARAAELIKAYPIPNTKEDLIEFIITSAANINSDAFNELKRSTVSSSDIAMSNAWLSKLEQAYQKASFMLREDDDFEAIKELYDTTKRRVVHAKRAMIRFWLIWAVFMAGLFGFIAIMLLINQ